MKSNRVNTRDGRIDRWLRAALLGLCLVGITPRTEAHKGPPYPIFLDQVIGPYMVSVWTDPDIGIGTFYIVFESNPDAEANISTDITSVKIVVEPTSGRLPEKSYAMERRQVRNGARYVSEVEFDRGDMWQVRVNIEGSGWGEELVAEVESTPDGSIGPIAVLIYALPFILIGAIWIRVIIARRQLE